MAGHFFEYFGIPNFVGMIGLSFIEVLNESKVDLRA